MAIQLQFTAPKAAATVPGSSLREASQSAVRMPPPQAVPTSTVRRLRGIRSQEARSRRPRRAGRSSAGIGTGRTGAG
jgi:hypothetical protein